MITQLFVPTKKNLFDPLLIRKSFLSVLTVALFLFNISADILIPGASSRVLASSITPNNIISLTNQERSNQGLSTLKSDGRLAAAAQAKAQDMLAKDYWDHFGPNGESPWQFISAAGYGYIYAGENLAKGFVSAEGVHQAWMASPTHRANIMNGNYKDIGVAAVEGTLQGEDVILVVQMFGSTTVTAPVVKEPTPAPVPPQPIPTPVEEPSLPDIEQGEIKSISIVRPSEGEVITDPRTDVSGTVDGYVESLGSYSVTLKRGDEIVASSENSSSEWTIQKGSDWEEGDHSLMALLSDDSGSEVPNLSDTVNFVVDSRAPSLSGGNISVKIEGNHAEVRVYTDDPEAGVYLTIGSETYSFTKDIDGSYLALIPKTAIDNLESEGQVLILTDEYGNTSEVELSGDMLLAVGSVLPVSGTSIMDSTISNLTSLSLKSKINLGVAIFLLIVLGVQLVFYRRHKKSGHQARYLLPMALFTFLVMIGTLTEITGAIS